MKKILCAVIILVTVMTSCSFGAQKKSKKIDLDLTKFSSVMVYSALFNVLCNPSAYIGQIIKIKGQFDFFHDEETNQTYYGVVIMDASACCSTGLDFVLKDSYKYPRDYPEAGDIITVSGRFEQYRDGEAIYCHLVDADLDK